ncbi:MAG: hypothetical protein ABI406_05460, partial [Ktedonobacteraceae bacterium]
ITSVYTGPGIFIEDKGLYIAQAGDTGCKTGKYAIRWIISQEGADMIAKGEKEHCEDFFYVFTTSIRLYADVVNQLAASNRVFQSQRQVENMVTRRVGIAPGKWQNVFGCLAAKTIERDNLKWHTPRPLKREPNFNTNCAFIQYIIAKSSLSEVGKHPSSEIIKDCGGK